MDSSCRWRAICFLKNVADPFSLASCVPRTVEIPFLCRAQSFRSVSIFEEHLFRKRYFGPAQTAPLYQPLQELRSLYSCDGYGGDSRRSCSRGSARERGAQDFQFNYKRLISSSLCIKSRIGIATGVIPPRFMDSKDSTLARLALRCGLHLFLGQCWSRTRPLYEWVKPFLNGNRSPVMVDADDEGYYKVHFSTSPNYEGKGS